MFSTEGFTPTYSAPATQSYGALRQSRNNAAADSAFQSSQRQFQAPEASRGLSAGSKALQYRAGIASDAQSAQGASALNKIYLDQVNQSQKAGLERQTGLAGERAGLRDLSYSAQKQQQEYDLTKESDVMQQLLATLSRSAQEQIGRTNRNSSLTYSILGNLF